MSKWKKYTMGELANVPRAAGVYAIYHDGEMVYIGMATDLPGRLSGHPRLPTRTRWAKPAPWRPVTQDVYIKVRLERFYGERATLELRLLRRLQPQLNCLNVRESQMALKEASRLRLYSEAATA